MRFGRSVPGDGFLPVFSVDTEEEAVALLTAACPRDRGTGEFIARELVEEQTLENLYAFGDRLREIYGKMKRRRRGQADG